MTRVVYEVTCPGCSKRLHAPSVDARRAQMIRHGRNCNALKKAAMAGIVAEGGP